MAKAKTDSVEKAESPLTAKLFIEKLEPFQSDIELKKYHRYFDFDENNTKSGDQFIGVKMGHVFTLAKEFIEMPISEIEKLLESQIHEIRAGGCSIMDKQGRNKKTTNEQRKDLFDLYIHRHDRINNWDLVDLCSIHVVGLYLFDKPRKILYQLAKSKNLWERRTSILSTAYFMRKNETEDAFKIAEILLHDKEDLINKAVGWMLRMADGIDHQKVIAFLDKHASAMPRITLRNTLEHFDKKQKEHYMGLKKQ